MSDIIITSEKLNPNLLQSLADQRYSDMVKGVIDIKTEQLAIGGELHADEESKLLELGSKQENLWGINIYIHESFPDNIEFDSVINIRPSQNNRSRYVEDDDIRETILTILKNRFL